MSITPDAEASALAAAMLDSELPATIIEETVASSQTPPPLEAGRSVCGTDLDAVLKPRDRRPVAVDFKTCSSRLDPLRSTRRRKFGIMHTHPGSLDDPEHSLPDWANIVYGVVDASLVVGTNTVDVVVAPAPDDRGRVEQAFVDAIGYNPGSPEGLLNAIRAGAISDPSTARSNVRSALAPLVDRRQSPIEGSPSPVAGAAARAEEQPVASAPVAMSESGDVVVAPGEQIRGASVVDDLRLRQSARNAIAGARVWSDRLPADVSGIVIGTIVGDLVSTGLDRVIF